MNYDYDAAAEAAADAAADAAHDEYISRLYEEWESEYADEIKEKGVQKFLHGLLRSYFVDHPELAKCASYRLHEARSLLPVNDSACLVLAYSAIEVGFKELLLKPTVTGFVHSSRAAPVIAEIVINRSTPKHFSRILEVTLAFIGIANHGRLKVGSRENSLWGHMARIKDLRNDVLHRGDLAKHADAEDAISIAQLIIDLIFPGLLRLSGLKLDNGVVVAA
jgi:hypothetical protein